MSGTKLPILLVMDFIGRNFGSALHAIQQWVPYIRRSEFYETTIGITTSQRRNDQLNPNGDLTVETALKMVGEYCRGLGFVTWDRDVDDIVMNMLSQEHFSSLPIYSDFNYGSIVNKGLLLADAMSCHYLIRIDPGTRPPSCDFDVVVGKHIDFIDHHRAAKQPVVVSRSYEGRLAVRDCFTIVDSIQDYYNLVAEMTGIHVHAQVTGGALFTSAVPGTPAIPFAKSTDTGELTLVWATDDGLYQLLGETRGSMNLGTIDVPRFDAIGKPKTSFEYFRGIAGMVFLSSLLKGSRAQDAAGRVGHFVERLKPMLNEAQCQQNDQEDFKIGYKRDLHWRRDFRRELVAPDQFLDQVEKGWRNYGNLLKEWSEISNVLKDRLHSHIWVK